MHADKESGELQMPYKGKVGQILSERVKQEKVMHVYISNIGD
jgi:hypothetical protein